MPSARDLVPSDLTLKNQKTEEVIRPEAQLQQSQVRPHFNQNPKVITLKPAEIAKVVYLEKCIFWQINGFQ